MLSGIRGFSEKGDYAALFFFNSLKIIANLIRLKKEIINET